MSAPEGGWSTREPPLNVDDLRRRLTSQESSALGTVGMSGARRNPTNSSPELTHDRRMLTWTYFSVRKESLRTNAARWSQRRSVPISANVSAVYEAPELTARSAQGFPRPSQATLFRGCVARPRSGRRVTPSVLSEVAPAGSIATPFDDTPTHRINKAEGKLPGVSPRCARW